MTPLCYLLGMVFSGFGHSYTFMIFLFPYAMFLGLLFNDITWYVGLPFFAFQFPLYGVVLGMASANGRVKPVAIGLAFTHILMTTLCLLLDLYQKS